ncbi:hypothetical protein CKF54_00490 [Psittacicella hinzii]|uniref:Uncharacterized protein n=1 Tax=Psittacicella hinzii TaxID=2028575 RepID=A0A3A1YBG2_9GAMM|nr:hypothetical protein [Psittacicella hinzii]RIY34508.1 hypothetical protein CKF54_00490 [Psittacicella hinzii]
MSEKKESQVFNFSISFSYDQETEKELLKKQKQLVELKDSINQTLKDLEESVQVFVKSKE